MRMTDEEKRQIEMAISAVERQTQGEIVLLVAPSSHFYGWVHGLWALGGWLLASAVMVLVERLGWRGFTLPHFVFFQVLTANVMALVSFVPALKRLTVPKRARSSAVLHAARANFFTSETEAATQTRRVYLYLSFFEREALVEGDATLRARTKLDYWQAFSNELTIAMQGPTWMVTLLRIIARLGDLLEEASPRPTQQEEDESVPPNQLYN